MESRESEVSYEKNKRRQSREWKVKKEKTKRANMK